MDDHDGGRFTGRDRVPPPVKTVVVLDLDSLLGGREKGEGGGGRCLGSVRTHTPPLPI